MYNFIRLAYDNYIANLFHRNKHEEIIRCDGRGPGEEGRELLDSELELVRGGMSYYKFDNYRACLLNGELCPHLQ